MMNNSENINNVIIRKATIQDVPEVCKMHVDSWCETYEGIVSKDYLTSLKSNLDVRIKKYQNDFHERYMIVATINDEIVGFSQIVFSNKFSSDLDVDSEIGGLYIKNGYKGKGIGTKLFNYIKEKFIEDNKKSMVLWCLKENSNAINFYKKMGGKVIKEKDVEIGNDKYKEIGFLYNLSKNFNLNDLIIREASLVDIENIVTLQVDGWCKTYKGIISDDYLNSLKNNIQDKIQETINWFNEDKFSKRFVATLEEEIIACFSLIFQSERPSNLEAEAQLSDMYVKDGYKGFGIGTKIFEFIKNFLLSNGKNTLCTWCFKDNVNALNFYKKKGGIVKKEVLKTISDNKYFVICIFYDLK